MVKYSKPRNGNSDTKGSSRSSDKEKSRYKDLLDIGRASSDIIHKLYTPVDATNRFLNLALDNVNDSAQSRQFLLESKTGVRQMAELLNELNSYAKKIEAVLDEISEGEV